VQRDGTPRHFARHPGAAVRPVSANATANHGPQGAAAGPGPADGNDWANVEICCIDVAANKITLRHGPIPRLDMPPMTTVFHARDATLLQGLRLVMAVRFRAQKVGGAYIVTDIKAQPQALH